MRATHAGRPARWLVGTGAIALASALLLAACREEPEGPGEAAEEVGDEIEDAGDEIEDEIDDHT